MQSFAFDLENQVFQQSNNVPDTGSVEALPHLYRWLADESEDVVTRHEVFC